MTRSFAELPGLIEEGSVREAANLPLRDTRLAGLLDPPPKVFVNDAVAATVGGQPAGRSRCCR